MEQAVYVGVDVSKKQLDIALRPLARRVLAIIHEGGMGSAVRSILPWRLTGQRFHPLERSWNYRREEGLRQSFA
jgi:hypothetical protein